MTSGNTKYFIRTADIEDVDLIKSIADQHKHELGFIVRKALERSVLRSEVIVAEGCMTPICGFAQFYHRRDGQTTLYNIAVRPDSRRHGIGRELMEGVRQYSLASRQRWIQLLCPEELEANRFYIACGYSVVQQIPGKHRPLNVWKLDLSAFFAI